MPEQGGWRFEVEELTARTHRVSLWQGENCVMSEGVSPEVAAYLNAAIASQSRVAELEAELEKSERRVDEFEAEVATIQHRELAAHQVEFNAERDRRSDLQQQVDKLTEALRDIVPSWGCTCAEDGFLYDDLAGECRWHKAKALLGQGA